MTVLLKDDIALAYCSSVLILGFRFNTDSVPMTLQKINLHPNYSASRDTSMTMEPPGPGRL